MIRKTLTFILIMIFLVNCESPYIFNRVITQKDGSKNLYGGVDISAFEKEPFSTWFFQEYDAYKPDSETVRKMRSKLKRYRIEVFIGTWDENSKIIYPRLMKVLHEAKLHDSRVVTYAVNKELKSFYGEGEAKDIQHLPTIIFYRGGEEVNRIVKEPVNQTIEQDILTIVSELEYTPNHTK